MPKVDLDRLPELPGLPWISANELFDQAATILGEPFVSAIVWISQLEMIESHDVKNSGMEVMDMNSVVARIKTDLVGRANDLTAGNAAAGHPHGEAVRVVVPPVAAL